jgi:hypothetical protein
MCQTRTTRIIWLSVIIFIIVILFQFFELPYVSVLSSSLLPARKVNFAGRPISSGEDLSSKNKNDTLYNPSNQTDITNDGSKSFELSPAISPASYHFDLNDTTKIPLHRVISVSEMNELLLKNRSSHSDESKMQSLSKVDEQLVYARLQIENASIVVNDSELYAPIFRNISKFKR